MKYQYITFSTEAQMKEELDKIRNLGQIISIIPAKYSRREMGDSEMLTALLVFYL